MEFASIKSPFDCILFDLDDTLYPSTLGISQVCKQNIEDYLARKCAVSAERASSLRVELFRSYGSSLVGLIALGYDVDPDEYHSLVHGTLPYDRIGRDPRLRELLLSIHQTKIIFTNSDRRHVSRVLERLGVEEECFHEIVCFETLNTHLFNKGSPSHSYPVVVAPPPEVVIKPSIAAMEAAVRIAGSDPRRTLFLDDSNRNIAAGKAVGLRTALIGKEKIKEADYVMEGMSSLKHVIPEIGILEAEKKKEGQGMTARIHVDSITPTTLIEA